jgi:hypothetical protein
MQEEEQVEVILHQVLQDQEVVEQQVLQQEMDQPIQVEEEVEDHLEIHLEVLVVPADRESLY